jgi:DNA modification methylase
MNEIIWWYYNKFQGNVNRFASDHDTIFWYRKGESFVFYPQKEEREKPVQQIKRVWDKEKGRIVNVKGEDGKVVYQESTHRTIDDVWRISMLQPADRTENLFYPTQKPEAVLDRIVRASSKEGDLVLDCSVAVEPPQRLQKN